MSEPLPRWCAPCDEYLARALSDRGFRRKRGGPAETAPKIRLINWMLGFGPIDLYPTRFGASLAASTIPGNRSGFTQWIITNKDLKDKALPLPPPSSLGIRVSKPWAGLPRSP